MKVNLITTVFAIVNKKKNKLQKLPVLHEFLLKMDSTRWINLQI